MSDLREAAWLARCTGRGELAPFSPEEIVRLAESVGVRHVAAGTPLMTEAQPVRAIGIIQHGEVVLTRRHGVRRVVLQVLHPGDVYGDIPFLCQMAPPFTARALSDAAVVELDADAFWALLSTRPHVCQRFLFSIASRLQRMQQRLLEVTAGDLQRQVASFLLDETRGGSTVIPLTQSTIAELLGATRPNVNRTLKHLEADGIVALGYRSIEVRDPAALQALVA